MGTILTKHLGEGRVCPGQAASLSLGNHQGPHVKSSGFILIWIWKSTSSQLLNSISTAQAQNFDLNLNFMGVSFLGVPKMCDILQCFPVKISETDHSYVYIPTLMNFMRSNGRTGSSECEMLHLLTTLTCLAATWFFMKGGQMSVVWHGVCWNRTQLFIFLRAHKMVPSWKNMSQLWVLLLQTYDVSLASYNEIAWMAEGHCH